MFKPLTNIPVPVLVLILSFLCPTEFSLMVDSFRLSPHRVVLLLLAPAALFRLLSRADTHPKSFDLVMLLFSLSSIAVFMEHMGADGGIKFGGSLALESFGAYIMVRAHIRNADDFRATVKVLLLAVIAAGLIALPETFLGKLFVHDTLRAWTGYVHPTMLEQRLGLTRAYGTFDHPIHFATFTASVLAMVWFSETRPMARRMKAALIGFITLLGVSSAPILCLVLQGGFIFWERITRTMARRVSVLVIAAITLYALAAAVMTRSPFAFVATGLTLDSWTGYYRLQIWQHGLNNVWANPWLGIGLADWVRPWWMVADTVDAFWLVLMMRQGIPSAFLLVLAMALLIRQAYVNGIRQQQSQLRPLAMGWLISLLALIMVAFTVHYWNVLFAYFCFIIGLGGVFADPLASSIAAVTQRPGAGAQDHCGIWAPASPWASASPCELAQTTRRGEPLWAASDIWGSSASASDSAPPPSGTITERQWRRRR